MNLAFLIHKDTQARLYYLDPPLIGDKVIEETYTENGEIRYLLAYGDGESSPYVPYQYVLEPILQGGYPTKDMNGNCGGIYNIFSKMYYYSDRELFSYINYTITDQDPKPIVEYDLYDNVLLWELLKL